MHYTLYGLLSLQMVLGFAVRWSDNKPLSIFGWLVPSPFASASKETHHLLGEAHEWIAWVIIIVASIHAAGALVHHSSFANRRCASGVRARLRRTRS